MAANTADTLKTQADCDAATASLTLELRTYQHRDYNLNYADENAATQATTNAARLAKATADVARYTEDLARPGQTPAEKTRTQLALITATAQRDRYALTSEALTGASAYLSDVDADQIDAQVAVLTAAKAAVAAHRATLSA
ncbi:hypothetical protein [Hymenobacter guriensis]|uniref:Uncharacterized protein n=1 Tax=Hymenobacter guriensis TaxID=2793065 RepID=A0ABS0L2M7_9BACT|nr:hypothetical protein [Hymenobacter guriensis]MBG8553637.1 hypothetical protein [Hymenobacter guriensis]